MENLIKHFARERPGVWTCLTPATVAGVAIPSGIRVLAGTRIDGVDVGQLLEEEYAKQEENRA